MQFLVALSLTAATAVCPSPPAREAGRPIDYVRTFVQALVIAHESAARPKPQSSDQTQAFIELLKLRQRDDECIVSLVSGFKESSHPSIKTSADTLAFVFEGLRDVNQKTIHAHEQYRDGKVEIARLLLFMEKSTEIVDDLWKMLPTAARGAVYALIESDAEGRATGRLTITEAQKSELLKTLRKTFGAEIEGGVQVGQTPLVTSAAAVHQFLANTKMKGE